MLPSDLHLRHLAPMTLPSLSLRVSVFGRVSLPFPAQTCSPIVRRSLHSSASVKMSQKLKPAARVAGNRQDVW